MKLFHNIAALIITTTIVLANEEPILYTGPVPSLIENTKDVVNEIHEDLQTNIEQSVNTFLGIMGALVTDTMQQIGVAFYAGSEKLKNCPQPWTMDELLHEIDDQLTKCAMNLFDSRTVFNGENVSIWQGIQNYITELANISAYCNRLSSGTTSSTSFVSTGSCFIQKLTELNRNMGQFITQSNTSFGRSGKLTKSGIEISTKCAIDVVKDFTNFLHESFRNC